MSAKVDKVSPEAQQAMQEVLRNTPTTLDLSTGRKITISYLLSDAQDLIDDLIVEHDLVSKQIAKGEVPLNVANRKTRQIFAKVAAAVTINSYFGLRLFWWLKWRIIYHFWRLSGDDYVLIFAEAKKKVMVQQSYLAMAFIMTMSDIVKTMTTKEAEAYHRELKSVSEQPL